jgi:hypothetical protein
MVFQKQIKFATHGHGDMHDLTEQVAGIATESNLRSGLIHLFSVGSTAALGAPAMLLATRPGSRRGIVVAHSEQRPVALKQSSCVVDERHSPLRFGKVELHLMALLPLLLTSAAG